MRDNSVIERMNESVIERMNYECDNEGMNEWIGE